MRGSVAQLLPPGIGVEQVTVVHLVEVVVFARQPEDGRSRQAVGRKLLRQADGGQRFVDAVSRPAEQAHLLAGDDGHGAAAQSGDVLFRLVPAAEDAVLLGEHLRHGRAVRLLQRNLPRSRREGSGVEGVMRKKRLDAGKAVQAVGKKSGSLRDLRERDTVRFHGSGHHTHGVRRGQLFG